MIKEIFIAGELLFQNNEDEKYLYISNLEDRTILNKALNPNLFLYIVLFISTSNLR